VTCDVLSTRIPSLLFALIVPPVIVATPPLKTWTPTSVKLWIAAPVSFAETPAPIRTPAAAGLLPLLAPSRVRVLSSEPLLMTKPAEPLVCALIVTVPPLVPRIVVFGGTVRVTVRTIVGEPRIVIVVPDGGLAPTARSARSRVLNAHAPLARVAARPLPVALV